RPEPVSATLERRLVPDPGAQELSPALRLRERPQALDLIRAEHASRDRQRISHLPVALDVDSDRVASRSRDDSEGARVREVELHPGPLRQRGLRVPSAEKPDRIRLPIQIAAEQPTEKRSGAAPPQALRFRAEPGCALALRGTQGGEVDLPIEVGSPDVELARCGAAFGPARRHPGAALRYRRDRAMHSSSVLASSATPRTLSIERCDAETTCSSTPPLAKSPQRRASYP